MRPSDGSHARTRLALAALVVSTLAAIASAQSGGTRPLPPHDYSLVVPAGPNQAEHALVQLRDGFIEALAEARILAPGFPQPGTLLRTPSETDRNRFTVSCAPLDRDSRDLSASGPYAGRTRTLPTGGRVASPRRPNIVNPPARARSWPARPAGSTVEKCVRLGPAGYIELGIVSFPDSRVYLFEVFPFDRQPRKPLSREAAYSLPRVVVRHPIFSDDERAGLGMRAGEVFDVLHRGLLMAGARPLAFK